MQRQGGGGNDPSCGCDMQAGWPPASEFPRGGLQGGGALNEINSFNLALTNKTGKTVHYKGKKNGNNNNNTNSMMSNNTNNNTNNNSNTNSYNNVNEYMSNMNNNNPNNFNNNPNNNKNSYNNPNEYMSNTNNNPMNFNNNPTNTGNRNTKTQKRMTSAPNGMEKIVLKGKRYYSNRATGNTYTRMANGNMGTYVGKMVTTKSGQKSLNKNIPEESNIGPKTPNLPENNIDIESEEVNEVNVKGGKPLSQNGGSFASVLSNLSMAGGGMPACGSCPFPGTGYCDFYAKGGGCGCGGRMLKGGYKPTRKNRKYLQKWKRGESIGFTMTSSLKAKGLIPRTSRKLKGKKVVSRKYR